MPTPPTSIPRKDLARGIDSYSAKGNIPEGFAEDLANVDTSASGQLQTRPGYEGYYGWLPLRVARATQVDATTLKLEFGTAVQIDLSTVRKGPLVVAGRVSSAATGSFGTFESTTPVANWYDGFELTASATFTAPSGTITQTSSTHGFEDVDFWVGAAEITTPNTMSNAAIVPDDVQIDTTTFDAAVAYTIATSATGAIYYRDQTATAGTKYNASAANAGAKGIASCDPATDVITTSASHELTVGDPVVFRSGGGTLATPLDSTTIYYVLTTPTADTFTISTSPGGATFDITADKVGTVNVRRVGTTILAATHNLDTFNIITRVFDTATVAGQQVEIDPYDVQILSTGDVLIVPVDPAASSLTFTGTAYLEAVPDAQAKVTTATVSGGGPTLNTVTIPDAGPFVFFSAYRYNSTTSRYESVTVDSWTYDDATDTVTIDYYLSGGSNEVVEIYWALGTPVANAISVTHAGTAGVDETPALTVWGLDHTGIYRDEDARGGHVTHLDAYKRVGERRLVAGLGGNLYRALSYAEGADTWDMGYAVANLADRMTADVYLAPLFHTTDPGSVRDRGVVYDASVAANAALCTAATYISSGVMDFTLTFTGKTGSVAIGSTIHTTDYLTVTGMSNSELNGEWAISSVTSDTATQTVVRVALPNARSSLNETGARGRAAVFTDRIPASSTVNAAGDGMGWQPDDILVGASVTAAALTPTVVSVTAAAGPVTFSGITAALQLTDGERLGVRRTSSVVPVTQLDGSVAATNLVSGDMLVVDGAQALDRRVRILGVRAAADTTVTLTGDGETVTATTGAAHGLNADDIALFKGAVTGEVMVLTVPTPTTFTYAGTATSGSTTLQGAYLLLDEAITAEASPEGETTFQVDGRWIPLEAPVTTYDLPADTYYRYLDIEGVDSQAALRSAIIQDSMYFTNADDEVLKFDGTYLTRAGLPRWQPGLFAANDTGATAKLAVGPTVAYSEKSAAGRYFVTATASFAAGDYIYESTADQVWLVTEIVVIPGDPGATPATPDTYQVVVRASDDISGAGASGTLQKVLNYKYYFKFNLIDRNQVIVASYAAQSEDFVVQYSQSGQIKLRLAGPPALGALDYDRVELEVYRTEGDGALSYLQSRRPVDFDRTTGYIDIADATSDLVLAPGVGAAHTAVNRDVVMTRLLGNELGTGWEGPPRASCVTTLSNRLLLGNVKGYPETTVDIRAGAGATGLSAAELDGTRFTFRKDSASAATTTDMTDVQRYEFVYSSSTFTFVDADVNTATSRITASSAHGLVTGAAVQLSNSGGALPTGLTAGTTYYAIAINNTVFRLAATSADAHAGTYIAIAAAAGGGTHTLSRLSWTGISGAAITGTSTTFVVTSAAHGLVAGDWVYLFHATAGVNKSLQVAGWWQIASVTTDTFTVAVDNSWTFSAADCDAYARATTATDIPVWLGVDGNYGMRDGNAAAQTDVLLQTTYRLSQAINAAQRVTTADLGESVWLSAFAGQDLGTGRIKIVCPAALAVTPEIEVTTPSTAVKIYVDGVDFSVSSYLKSFVTKVFPARLVRSYPNYPDLFDAPLATDAIDSDSIIDVNPADGQAITNVVPFFGEGAGAGSNAALSQIAVVVKELSVYVVNVETREVTKLDTRGMGGVPRAVCATQAGIMLLNESGVYRLNRDLSLSPVGLLMTGQVRDRLNKDQLSEAHAHHWAQGRRVKISVPVDDETYPSEVWVYDYEREGKGQEFGAWTRYTEIPAVGWANLETDEYWASQSGDVFVTRQRGDETDYRDEDGAVAEAVITHRAEDFGLPGIRKVIHSVVTELELDQTDVTGLTVQSAQNLSRTFTTEGAAVSLDRDDLQQRTFRTSLAQRRGNRIQIRHRHQTKDQALVLTGLSYTVGSLTSKLLPEQADQV